MKKTSWFYVAGGAVAAIAVVAWAFAPRPVEVEAVALSQGSFQTTIDEDGKTRLRERYVVSAPLAGLLTRISLREGDTVAVNAVVASMTPVMTPLLDERSVREQRLRIESAQAREQAVLARVEGAKVGVLRARNEAQRSEQLARQGFVAPTKLETDRLGLMAAQKDLDAAVQERHVAAHEVEQAQAALLAVREPQRLGAGGFALRSPIAGSVLRVLQPSETVVTLGTPLLELGDTQALEIVAELLTGDALRALPGSAVLIERWGGSGVLQGRVRLVEPAAFTKVSALGVEEQRVKVLIDIASPPEQWRALGDGYRVGVRIVTLAMEQALQVPVSAVFPVAGAEGGMAVFVVEAGRARLTQVTVGARNSTHAWLKRGPASGTPVIVYPPATVKDGARVKLRSV
nr:efflux transporter periplasmic adaptor subunit [uncultured Roseateles sp.]